MPSAGSGNMRLDLARGLSARGVETVLALLGPAPDAAQRRRSERDCGRCPDRNRPAARLAVRRSGAGRSRRAGAIAALAQDERVRPRPAQHAGARRRGAVRRAGGRGRAWLRRDLVAGRRCAETRSRPNSAGIAALMARGLARRRSSWSRRPPAIAATIARHYDLPALAAGRPQRPRTARDRDRRCRVHDRVLHRRAAVGSGQERRRPARPRRGAPRRAVRRRGRGRRAARRACGARPPATLLGQLDDRGARPCVWRRGRCSSPRRRFEPFGLAVLEAARAGCALVLSDIATFRELWDGAALFVARRRRRRALPRDRDADRRCAICACRLGEQARRRARRYTPQATADSDARRSTPTCSPSACRASRVAA